MVRALRGVAQREVLLDHPRAEHVGDGRHRDPVLVVGEPDDVVRVSVAERRDDGQVELLDGGRVRRGALQETDLIVERRERVHGAVDILERRAAARDDHRLAEGGDVPEQGRVAEVAGGDLESRDVELGEEVGARLVECGGEEDEAELGGQSAQLDVGVAAELQRLAVLAVRRPEAVLVLVGALEEFAREEPAVVALLQLDRVDPRTFRRAEELLGPLEAALVVVADLGDHEAGRVVGDPPPVDLELAHRAIVAPCPADAAGGDRTMPPMTGAVLLVATLAALIGTGWCAAACLARDSVITAALVVPVVAYAEIVCLAFVLSAFGWLGRAGFLVGLAACLAGALAVWHAAGRPRAPFRRGVWQLRAALDDPALAVLAVLAALAAAYMTILALATPQLDWDSNAYHLPRAVLWLQQGGIGEIGGASDVRLSWAPPGAEIAIAFTMAVARSDRYVALPQLAALAVAVVAVVGLARRVGFAIRPALFAGLVFGCLPIVLLQSATTFNDLVVGALLLAALFFALGGTRRDAGLAAVTVALALVTKLTAALALPLLVVVALLVAPRAWRSVTASAAAGALVGSLWYVANRVRTGSFDGGWAEMFGQEPDRSPGEVLLRAQRYTLDFFDLSGFAGADRWWLPIAGGVLGIAALVVALRGAARRRVVVALGAATLVAVLPWLLEGTRFVAVRVFAYALRAVGSGDRLSELARDPSTTASPFSSWYGAVFALLWVVSLVVAAREIARRRLSVGVLALLLAPPAFALLFALGTVDDGARGRFFAFPVGMAAAAFPLAYRFGAIRLAVPAAVAATIAVNVVHSEPRPLGVELLEPVRTPAVWGDDLVEAYDAMARMFGDHPGWVRLDRALAGTERLAVADRWEFPLYPLFGGGNRRRLVLVRDPRRAPAGVGTLLVTPRARRPRCDEPWRPRLFSPDGYALYERSAGGRCDDGRATDG